MFFAILSLLLFLAGVLFEVKGLLVAAIIIAAFMFVIMVSAMVFIRVLSFYDERYESKCIPSRYDVAVLMCVVTEILSIVWLTARGVQYA